MLGAVAPIPWRSLRPSRPSSASRSTSAASAAAAGEAAVVGAEPLSDNGYKVGLVQTLVRRTLASLA